MSRTDSRPRTRLQPFRSANEKILNQAIRRPLEFLARSVKINSALVQIGDVIGDVKSALHVVRHHYAGDMETFLQPPNQLVDAVGNYRIEAGGWFII